MKTAVIYARYSSERQTEQSIEGQLRVCYKFAEEKNIKIVDTYIDRAMTGTNDKRNDFQRMLRDSNKKAWDYVLVYKIDRFGRNKYEIAMNKHTLKNNQIKLISATENIPDTPEGIILESLLEGMAEYYSAELSQKVRRGMNESRQKGNFTGGTLPYGFKKDGKKIIVDEDKAKIVVYIYEQYANNIFVKDIIKDLTKKGILYKNKPFARSTLYKMLTNEKYAGIYHYNGEIFSNTYPRIVPDKLFKIVQNKSHKNKSGSRSPFVKYALRKKIICGYCNNTINGTAGSSKSCGVKRYYSCAGKYRKKICQKKPVRKEYLEKTVISALINTFESDALLNKFADEIIKIRESKYQSNPILNILKDKQKHLETSRQNMLYAIEQGIITSTTKNRLLEIESQLNELQDQILTETFALQTHIDKKDIISYIKKALSNNYEQLIELLVDKIILYDDKVEIYCKYLNESKKISNEDITLLEKDIKLPIPAHNNSTVEFVPAKLEIKTEP